MWDENNRMTEYQEPKVEVETQCQMWIVKRGHQDSEPKAGMEAKPGCQMRIVESEHQDRQRQSEGCVRRGTNTFGNS